MYIMLFTVNDIISPWDWAQETKIKSRNKNDDSRKSGPQGGILELTFFFSFWQSLRKRLKSFRI